MSYTLRHIIKGKEVDGEKTMEIDQDPKGFRILDGFLGPDGNAWRIVDIDRSSTPPIFKLLPESRVPHHPTTESKTHRH